MSKCWTYYMWAFKSQYSTTRPLVKRHRCSLVTVRSCPDKSVVSTKTKQTKNHIAIQTSVYLVLTSILTQLTLSGIYSEYRYLPTASQNHLIQHLFYNKVLAVSCNLLTAHIFQFCQYGTLQGTFLVTLVIPQLGGICGLPLSGIIGKCHGQPGRGLKFKSPSILPNN